MNGDNPRDREDVNRARHDEDESLVKLATVHSEQLAQMYAEMLHNEGIPCVVKGTGGWSSAMPLGVNEHFLFVPKGDVERASSLLTGYGSPGDDLALDLPQARAAGRGRRWRPQEGGGHGSWH
jgi:hypothetical protein